METAGIICYWEVPVSMPGCNSFNKLLPTVLLLWSLNTSVLVLGSGDLANRFGVAFCWVWRGGGGVVCLFFCSCILVAPDDGLLLCLHCVCPLRVRSSTGCLARSLRCQLLIFAGDRYQIENSPLCIHCSPSVCIVLAISVKAVSFHIVKKQGPFYKASDMCEFWMLGFSMRCNLDHHVQYAQMCGDRVVRVSNLNQKPQSPWFPFFPVQDSRFFV